MFYGRGRALHNDIVGPGVTAGIGILFIILGTSWANSRQNWFVGLRHPWTLEDPEVWQKSQRLAGWMFVLGGSRSSWTGATARRASSSSSSSLEIVLAVSLVPIVYRIFWRHRKSHESRVTESRVE